MRHGELIPHLFRTEFRKMVSVLAKHFGIAKLDVAEDIVGDTFLAALEIWPYKGIPANPTAWLYTVAKNKTKNHLSRVQRHATKETQIGEAFHPEETIEINWSDSNIADSQLQMLFAVCHPAIPEESQICLALRVLGGLGIEEIANAFLTNKETINKRLSRAKEKWRIERVAIEYPGDHELRSRMEAVLRTIYLLFNEGYYSESDDQVLREELCLEAIRLAYALAEQPKFNHPHVHALLALMCFHASRFPSRRNEKDELVLYAEQDEKLWNQELIAKGAFHLREAAQGTTLSKYHLEASIAYWSTVKADTAEKWESILHLYNQLLQLEYSPIAALNRTFALSKVKGAEVAIIEAEKLKLENNRYYFTLLGALYKDLDNAKSRINYEKAYSLAKTKGDKAVLERKLAPLRPRQVSTKT